MHKRSWLPRKLSTQLIILLISLVVLTAFAIGIPAIWLINRQIVSQFWDRIDQGQKASQALLHAEGRDIDGLAELTAQRPTLRQFLSPERLNSLAQYLDTLREGAGLDFLVICDSTEPSVLAFSGAESLPQLCSIQIASGSNFLVIPGSSSIGMLASSEIVEGESILGRVVVGRLIDRDFATAMKVETGLEHTFLSDGIVVASSLNISEPYEVLKVRTSEDGIEVKGLSFETALDGVPYYVARQTAADTTLMSDVSLSAEALNQTRLRLGWGWLGGMLGVMAVGSVVGLLLSRRIGLTFDHLASAAVAFQRGDLDTPVQIDANLVEAYSVAQALESARRELNITLLQLRGEKEWSDQLLDSIVEGIIILDPETRITFFSSGAERISGWTRDEVLMNPCDPFFQPLAVEETFSQLIPPRGSKTILDVEMAQGRRSSLAITAADFKPSSSEGLETLLVFRDVSEEQATHRVMGHFMANVSHEFRTPLSAIAASTELLMDQLDTLSSQDLHELLTALHIGILNLSTLVDNLIESASIETGHFRVTPRPVDLAEIIGEAIQMMQPLVDKRQQKLEIVLPISIPEVKADPRRTVQVITNLLSNASKFGPTNSTIQIVVKAENRHIKVEIHDRGPGVAQEYRDYVFERFFSVSKDVVHASYGVGLGLSVVKAIVEAGGGEVGITENPEGGAIFWFTLPEV